MKQKNMELKYLTDILLSSVREYGIKEVSMQQYEVVCRNIIKYSYNQEKNEYYDGLQTEYDMYIFQLSEKESICKEYARFHRRVMRMLASLAETGTVDFSSGSRCPRKYYVSQSSAELIVQALDYHSLEGEARIEMDIVLRHFFNYAEQKTASETVVVTDDLLMDFFTGELPKTNQGSMGRSLRAIKYLSVYLKNNGSENLILDFTQLNARSAPVRIIPPYSQDEIAKTISTIDTETSAGLRDYAIMLLAFDTGLRGIDIRALCMEDIDWYTGRILIRQSKTSEQLILPMSGKVMNAVADYILNGRPECNIKEVFLNVRGSLKPLDRRYYCLGGISEKYFNKAEVKKISGRGFHSLRRSFATELSEAGVPLETISQLLGHKRMEEDKPYLSYNREQVSFCAMSFEEIPIKNGIYSGGDSDVDD